LAAKRADRLAAGIFEAVLAEVQFGLEEVVSQRVHGGRVLDLTPDLIGHVNGRCCPFDGAQLLKVGNDLRDGARRLPSWL
jgi:hypothetical protein